MVKNKIRYTVACLANLIVFSFITPSLTNDIKSVFYISKSDNGKQVHYGIILNEDCLPANDEPVYPYWLMPSGIIEKLAIIGDPQAYGIASQTISRNQIDITLNSFKNFGIQKTITLVTSKADGKCGVKTYTTINQLQKQLSHAHLDLADVIKTPIDGSTLRGRLVRLTIFSTDGNKEIVPCNSNCKFGAQM